MFITCDPVDGEARAHNNGHGLSFAASELKDCAEVEFTKIMNDEQERRKR